MVGGWECYVHASVTLAFRVLERRKKKKRTKRIMIW